MPLIGAELDVGFADGVAVGLALAEGEGSAVSAHVVDVMVSGRRAASRRVETRAGLMRKLNRQS